ncbi:Na+-transporting NADH:ubiquinone oxidoreductase, subunit NqrB [Nostoc sp. PCC 7524]|uniref:RnfABCDGE type electron transport complex subunit D n=1 Tax=Nostoc sp. (strain ATCC 29411 / PCC 7524) TaxID=28072 RepID=UPI00029F1447|nr:RnfABCDGE type electron transport complex subunit D [Nostoc sp. PCC 7524]AFY48203.1 Na+-transporting NADH:ubiquinone oxidoreductase, subunit NqrB [Nostoc sp. PCC 7524]
MLLKDIRDYQILFLSLFLILGIGTRDWTLRPELIAVAITTCLATQCILSLVKARGSRGAEAAEVKISMPNAHSPMPNPLNIRSALITALGLSLLLRADHWTTMALAAASAIASKFFLQVNNKHFFNPANFGIISALVFTSDAWVSPGQWGEEWWYGLLFAGAGGMILQRIGRWDTTAAFLGAYSLLEAMRNLWLGWTWDVYWHRLMSGSLLLFALFMVTDPRSIPNARLGRIVWAVCIAIFTFILRNYFFIPTAVFWALFIFAPLTILFDFLYAAPQFSWVKVRKNQPDEQLETDSNNTNNSPLTTHYS